MGTLTEKLQRTLASKENIKNAIENKGVTVGDIPLSEYADRILSINTDGKTVGGGKDVLFYDYDGTLLYAYSTAEALSLTSLPPLPSHEGLICQEWNYTLDDMKSYIKDYNKLNIGATYITDDGKTRLYIEIESELATTVPLYFNQTSENSVIIEWGDGTTESLSGTGYVNTKHTYSTIGSYIISLNVTYGTLSLGASTTSNGVLGSGLDACKLTHVEFGKNINSVRGLYGYNTLKSITVSKNITTIADLNSCSSLESITIPKGASAGTSKCFNSCYSLKSINIPNGTTTFGTNLFEKCYSLKSITIPTSVTTMGDYTFTSCYSIESIIIPNSVSSFGKQCFQYCYNLKSIIIPNSITTTNTSCFNGCTSLLEVALPISLTGISQSTFSSCSSLRSIIMPNNLSSIYESAFSYCKGLQLLDCSQCSKVPSISTTSIPSANSAQIVIKVPSSLYDEWIAATNWSSYAENIIAV